MMDMYTNQQLVAVCLGLMSAGFFYNLFINVLATYIPPSFRRTSIEVVIGVGGTLIAAGFLFGGKVMLVLFVLFACSGTPMILGDFKRGETVTG